MLDRLRGTLRGRTPTGLRLEIGPVVLHVRAAVAPFARLRDGDEVEVHTHLVLREDGPLLFGFADPRDRELFLALQRIQGLGAERALALLDALGGAPAVLRAVAAGDVAALKRVKGIGERIARRVIHELAAREDLLAGLDAVPEEASARDAEMALVRLGFPRERARRALERALERLGDAATDALVKEALAHLAPPSKEGGRP